MRLGDLDALFVELWRRGNPFDDRPEVHPAVVWSAAATLTREAPTINPEDLPIVQQLREELARVTAERDEYKELFFSYKHVCGGIEPQRIGELVEADKTGRCVVLPDRKHTSEDGENALKSAMNTCYYHNNPVTRYIADAVVEKLVREAAQDALKGGADHD